MNLHDLRRATVALALELPDAVYDDYSDKVFEAANRIEALEAALGSAGSNWPPAPRFGQDQGEWYWRDPNFKADLYERDTPVDPTHELVWVVVVPRYNA